MLWNPTTYLQTCIQIETAEWVLNQFQFYGWQYIRHAIWKGFQHRACPPEAPLYWDVLLCRLLTNDKTDNLDIKMLWGNPAHNFLELEEEGTRRREAHLRPVCRSGDVWLWAGQPQSGCVLLLSVPWHTGYFNPESLLTGTSQPATMRYSFTATLVFIISAARPH